MSFKLFFASTFGRIKSTEKIEAEHEALLRDYQSYCKFEQSAELKEYNELETLVKSPTFVQRKKELQHLLLKGSKEEAQLKELHKLERNQNVRKYLADPKSNEKLKDSAEIKQYEQLLKTTQSKEFKERVAYLEDEQKWEKTADSAKEKRLEELKKSPELQNYLKYKHGNAFEFFKKWNLVFEDRFDSGKLDPAKWSTVSHAAAKTIGQNYSQPGDLQAFTDGKNISLDGKSMKIEVRREKAKSMSWKLPFGFVEEDFNYTSGLISTGENGWWKHGIVEAKVKYSPSHNLVDAIYLIGEENSLQVNLVEMGVKNRLGVLARSGAQIQEATESISGLKDGAWYIFRLEWTAHSLTWKINNYEILHLTQHVPGFKMHLNAASVVVDEPGNLPHRFEIDWVRFYQHHQN